MNFSPLPLDEAQQQMARLGRRRWKAPRLCREELRGFATREAAHGFFQHRNDGLDVRTPLFTLRRKPLHDICEKLAP